MSSSAARQAASEDVVGRAGDAAPIRLTGEERALFEHQGYLVVPGALPADRVDALLAAARRLMRDGVAAEDHDINWMNPYEGGRPIPKAGAVWERFRAVERDPAFLDLIDFPPTLHRIIDILNCNIYMSCSHLKFRFPQAAADDSVRGRGWHRDLGTSMYEMQEPHPRLSVVAAFWLTELSRPNFGALRVVPGSHRLIGPPCRDPATGSPYGAIEILAQPGDVLLFDNRLWHSGSENLGTHERICLFYRYVYRWIRPSDYVVVPDELLGQLSPVRQQLLGKVWTDLGYLNPSPEKDLPLLRWWQAVTKPE